MAGYALPLSVRETLTNLRFVMLVLARSPQRKHAWRWVLSQRENYLLDQPMPWIAFDAIQFLEANVKPKAQVFEFGSGGSTLYWLSKQAECISVEHDAEWHQRLCTLIKPEQQIGYRLVLPETANSPSLDPSDPALYASDDPHFVGMQFQRYVTQIDSFLDDHFDFILIDGRARTSCLLHSLSKVRVGGSIILDNSDRPYYTERLHPQLSAFLEQRFYGIAPASLGYTQTTIFTRQR